MKTTYVFDKLLAAAVDPNIRGVSSRGGTRSSKTWSMLQLIYLMATQSETPLLISCVTDTLPGVKRGMFRDFKRMLQDEGVWEEKRMQYTEMIYTTENGSQIEFFGCENSAKVFGPARDILFVNEAQRVPKEVFRQMAVRTRLMLFVDFNPVKKFWAHDYFTGDNMVEIVSTYRDNPYLTPEQVEEIESNKSDANWWRVFGEGETGGTEGLIFPEYELVQDFPADAKYCLGMDFGFTGDPTAIVKVGFVGDVLYLQEIAYTPGLLNWDIANLLKSKGLHKVITVADIAEQKSIAEISRLGCKVIPCIKGRGSIMAGIAQIKQFKRICVVVGSRGITDELDTYSYVLDRMTGLYDTTEAIDDHNHAMDATRYAVDFLITKYKPGKARNKE